MTILFVLEWSKPIKRQELENSILEQSLSKTSIDSIQSEHSDTLGNDLTSHSGII